jgi:hypothetical protein
LFECFEFWKLFLDEVEEDILELLFSWFSFGFFSFFGFGSFCFCSDFGFFSSFGFGGDFGGLSISFNFISCCFLFDEFSPVFNCFLFIDSNVLFVPSEALFEFLNLENGFS